MAVLRPTDFYSFGDFAPDLDTKAPNIVTDANWVWRTGRGGWRSMGPVTSVSSPAITVPVATLSAFAAQLPAQVTSYVFGTAQQLYTWDGKSADGIVNQNLTLAATTYWQFDQYGNDVIGVNANVPPYASIDGTAWGQLAGSPPTASDVAASDYSLWLLDASVPNKLWYSLNDQIWTASIQTQTGTLVLTSTPGPILAIAALRSGLMAYKGASMFFIQFTGAPPFWQVGKISDQIGITGVDAWISTGTLHYFLGPDNFYQTDGFSVTPIPNNLRKWFFENCASLSTVIGQYDWQHSQAIFWFQSTAAAAGVPFDRYISLSLLTGEWSTGYNEIQTPVAHTRINTPTLQFLPLGNTLSQCDPSETAGDPANPLSWVQGGDLGDNFALYRLSRMRPSFLNLPPPTNYTPNPAPPELQVLATYIQGQAYNKVANPKLSGQGWFDSVTAQRLARPKVSFYHGCEISGFNVLMDPVGVQ